MKTLNKILVQIFSNFLIASVLFVLVSFMFFQNTKEVSSGEMDGVYYHGNTNQKAVSLMVNVYWGEEFLDDMLNVFEKYKIKTTFFVGGVWASKNTDYLTKIVNLGHEIGNHGFFHKDHSKLNYSQNIAEIKNNHTLIKEITGKDMKLFAPPSGAYANDTILATKKLGYKTILWTKDTIDWRDHDENLIFKRATNISNGDLILMHPTAQTLASLENIIKSIFAQSFKIISVSENISTNIV